LNRDFLQEVIEALLWTSRALEIAHDRAVDYGEISTKLGVPDNNRGQFQAMVRSRVRENIKLLSTSPRVRPYQ